MSAEDRLLYLSIPDWFPQPLEDVAHRLHASRLPEDKATVQRLVGDTRMKAVWVELQKRRRVDGAFVHDAAALIREFPAEPHGPLRPLLNDRQKQALFWQIFRGMKRLDTAEQEQQRNLRKLKRVWEANPKLEGTTGFADFGEVEAAMTSAAPEMADHGRVETSTAYQFAAMEVVFREAVSLGNFYGSTHFWKQIRHSYVERASKARSDALFLERAGRHHIKGENNAHALREHGKVLQKFLRKIAEKYETYAKLLADGHLDSSASVEFVRQMAGTLNDLFGKRLTSTVARIASVALDRAITHTEVRDWCL
jgi:hypothetical protein